jgi:uncharacterized membrane protein
MRSLFAVAIAIALVWGVSGCDTKELSSGAIATKAFPPKFSAIRDRILVPRCQYCHTNFESYEAVHELAAEGELLEVLVEGEMPENGARLMDEEIDAIRQWIANGGAND